MDPVEVFLAAYSQSLGDVRPDEIWTASNVVIYSEYIAYDLDVSYADGRRGSSHETTVTMLELIAFSWSSKQALPPPGL